MAERRMDRAATAGSYEDTSSEMNDEENFIDVTALLQAILRGRRSVCAITLAVFLVATAVAFLIPAKYTSSTTIIPPSSGSSSSIATAVAGQVSSALGAGAADLITGGMGKGSSDLFAGVLRSRSVACEMVKRFDLMHVYKAKKESQAEKALSSDTEVIADAKSPLVTVEVTASSPALAHDMASAYVDVVRDANERLALSQASQRRLFFEQQLAKEKDNLADAEVELKKDEEKSGLIAPSGQTESEIKTIAATQAQLAVRQVELTALRNSATDQNPEVIRLRSEIGDLQGQLSRMQRGGDSESSLVIPTSKVPELQLDYVRKTREVKYHEALFEMLARQYEAARLDEARDAPVIQVLDPASYPDAKSSPKRAFYMLGGLFFGFFAGCVWVLMREKLWALRVSLATEKQPEQA
ncbi:MAG: GNVR domain-containing protein [Acidobacteriaceae bacterium]|nr:GNVR domain-containing protein [Acidobacteriaceae bacterium]